jgi:hypothetical protein
VPGFLVHVGATVQCLHQAPVSTAPTQSQVLVSGQPVATTANLLLVAGCPFFVALKPQPCVQVKWTQPATRVLINGLPALLQTPPGPGPGAGVCLSPEQLPQGIPLVSAIQARVLGM